MLFKILGIFLTLGLFAGVSWAKDIEITTTTTTVNISVGGSKRVLIDSTADDFYVLVAGKTVSFELEPDEDGAEVLAQVTVYSCSKMATTSCLLYQWDSDFDGVPDTGILDGVTLGQRGVEGVRVPHYLKFDTTAAPTSGATVLTIDAIAQGL